MKLRYFYKIDHNKQPIPGSNVRRKSKPGNQWKEILSPCCYPLDVDCTCGPRFFVQLDGRGKPVDGTLIKRTGLPKMEENIKYYELDWKSPCCTPAEEEFPGEFLIMGFGGDSICTGGTASFYVDQEAIQIGTRLYEEDRLTPVSFNNFRDDATGIVYTVASGIVTGVAEENCSQLIQALVDLSSGFAQIENILVDNVAVEHDNFSDLPLNVGTGVGVFHTVNSSPGYKTFKLIISGDSIPLFINIADSEGTFHQFPTTGPGEYECPGIYTSGPNEITAGIGISLTDF